MNFPHSLRHKGIDVAYQPRLGQPSPGGTTDAEWHRGCEGAASPLIPLTTGPHLRQGWAKSSCGGVARVLQWPRSDRLRVRVCGGCVAHAKGYDQASSDTTSDDSAGTDHLCGLAELRRSLKATSIFRIQAFSLVDITTFSMNTLAFPSGILVISFTI